MRQTARFAILVFLSIAALGACNDPAKSLAEAQPAVGSQLQEYSRQWNDKVELARAAPLLQRYCKNISGAACTPDAIDRLKQYGFSDGGTGVDLAYAFITMAADAKDGVADQKATDEDFIHSCYLVMLGREADPEGAAHHLATITGKSEDARKALATSFLRSPEFNSQK